MDWIFVIIMAAIAPIRKHKITNNINFLRKENFRRSIVFVAKRAIGTNIIIDHPKGINNSPSGLFPAPLVVLNARDNATGEKKKIKKPDTTFIKDKHNFPFRFLITFITPFN